MFSGCKNLTEIPALLATSNTSTGSYQEMFSDCIRLTNIPISSLSCASIPSAGYAGMFKGCNSLQKVGNIFNSNDAKQFTLTNNCCSGMFEGCYELSDISEFKFPTNINTGKNQLFNDAFNRMFANCPNLTKLMPSIVYPDYRSNTKTSFKGASGVYFGLFEGCSGLTETPKLIFEIKNANDVNNKTVISGLLQTQEFAGMFKNCTSLSKVYTEQFDLYFREDIEYTGFNDWLYNVAASRSILYR
jgi:hypothetical protein